MSKSYGLLIDYDYCTGCHSCETACKMELGLPLGQYGIKIVQDGPRKLESGKWEYNYLPIPTSLCNLCEDRVNMGKKPTCVHHCQAAVMTYGTVEELAKQMEGKPKMVLFTPK
ncbi:MAG TPA: 4Fe-4S binding protein [Desulfitobacterium dehalogenans]|uniref:4Fe-4S binding protein n=1 Tax=Desulfitobacterium dehalogenans TaxID=36854 RepID=A0A7C7DCH3_9FIRM|nr:4Fe-4S binding protein [Desulfitobacterium dehalogenans]